MLRSACIYTAPNPHHGKRISIMSRHTDNTGNVPDPNIVPGVSYDLWWKELSPLGTTVGPYHRGEIDFAQLTKEYLERLCSDPASVARVQELIRLAGEQDVTVLCQEPTPQAHQCHRSVLLVHCAELYPSLEIDIL